MYRFDNGKLYQWKNIRHAYIKLTLKDKQNLDKDEEDRERI